MSKVVSPYASWEEAIDRKPHIALTGYYGAGKTAYSVSVTSHVDRIAFLSLDQDGFMSAMSNPDVNHWYEKHGARPLRPQEIYPIKGFDEFNATLNEVFLKPKEPPVDVLIIDGATDLGYMAAYANKCHEIGKHTKQGWMGVGAFWYQTLTKLADSDMIVVWIVHMRDESDKIGLQAETKEERDAAKKKIHKTVIGPSILGTQGRELFSGKMSAYLTLERHGHGKNTQMVTWTDTKEAQFGKSRLDFGGHKVINKTLGDLLNQAGLLKNIKKGR